MPAKKPSVLDAIRRAIHPPLPLNPRQTQQLQSALSKSLKLHLDQEHGDSKAAQYITGLHVENILGSAHFSTGVKQPGDAKTQQSRNDVPFFKRRIGDSGEQVQVQERQSALLVTVDQFVQEVAAGEATLDSAKKCMVSARLLGSTSEGNDQQQPGQAVHSWLHSTGLLESLEFLHDKDFVKLLVYHLYKEQLQPRIQSWYAQYLWHPSPGIQPAVRNLATVHVRTEAKSQGLNSAVGLFNKLAAKLQVTQDPSAPLILSDSTRFLAYQLMPVTKPVARPEIDVAFHEKFVQNARACLRHIGIFEQDWYFAALDLSHPQAPAGERALAFLSKVHDRLDHIRNLRPGSFKLAKIVYLHVITAKYLTSQGRLDDAMKWKSNLLALALTPDVCEAEIELDPDYNDRTSSLLVSLRNLTGQDRVFHA